jgi:hypothetical protein
MNSTRDYYAILGVLPSIDQAALVAVYRALQKKYHPDVYQGDRLEGERIIRELNEAYEVLGDPKMRAEYDRDRAEESEQSGDYSQARERDPGAQESSAQEVEGWEYVKRYYPEVEKSRAVLALASSTLALSFQVAVLKDRNFADSSKLSKMLLDDHLRRYFGPNRDVQLFAFKAIIEGRRDIALEVNKAIRVLGSPADRQSGEFLERIANYFNWNHAEEMAKGSAAQPVSNRTPAEGTWNVGVVILVAIAVVVIASGLLAISARRSY